MSENWPLDQNEYQKAEKCDVSITGKREDDIVSLDNYPRADSVGVSGGRIRLEVEDVDEPFELHVWGYRIDVTVYCDNHVEIPVYVHSTAMIKEKVPEDIKEKIDEIEQQSKNKNKENMIKRLRDEHSEEVEKEGTRRVNISIMGGVPDVRTNAPAQTWHEGAHSSIESF